ncbi:GL20762 [Drosophila persimilis]|uniref:GL20762 n=1 Tax=Drosophila persimilis TaxID=7234 RepID=B4H3Z5_DROPE|nr:GL20762 [Drosophila persimilis]
MLLVTAEPCALEVLRGAFARSVLKPPATYMISSVGDIDDCIVTPTVQGQFTPLPEALCDVIMDLTAEGQSATVEHVRGKLGARFPHMTTPATEVIYDTLAQLMQEQKIYQTSKGILHLYARKEQEEQWLRLLDKKLQGDMVCESLPLPIMMVTTIEPVRQKGASKKDEKSATFSSAGFSKTLLESVVAIKNLMVIKQKTVDDFIQLNKEFETLRAQPTVRRDPKSTAERDEQQRCFAAHMIALHRVNGDILKPLRILHQFLDEYKEMEDLKAKTMTARERFQQCRLQSDLDLKAAEAKLGLVVKSDATRDLIRTLHTILYLCGALSSEKSADIRTIIDDIMASTMVNMPPDLSAVFKQMLSNVTPLCEAFGRVRKEPT